MLRLIPVICITTRAVRMDSGMEIAATSVARRLHRNRKMVRTANSAPRPPSRISPSVDSLMKSDRSDTVVTTIVPGWRAAISSSLSWTASATRTVLASDVLVTDSDRDGLPLVRANPVVATSTSSTVPRSPIVIGVGAAGAVGSDGAGAGLAFGSTATGGTAAGVENPTTMSSMASCEVSVPIVETGILVPPSDSWPDGNVTLLAVRTPVICATDTPASARSSGSRVIVRRVSRPPVTSARETPSMAAISGTISVRAISAAASRPSSVVAPMDAIMTGEALMLRADAVVLTPSGRPASAIPSSIAASASLTSVPYSNWAMTRAMELAEVDCTVSRRATPEMARSIGTATLSATSCDPAPGYGAMTVMTGNSMSGRSSCLRVPHAEMPAMNSAPARRSVTLRLLTAS